MRVHRPNPNEITIPMPKVAICVLTYGGYPHLAARAIESIRIHCPRSQYRLVVGANAVGDETKKFLTEFKDAGEIDQLIISRTNQPNNFSSLS